MAIYISDNESMTFCTLPAGCSGYYLLVKWSFQMQLVSVNKWHQSKRRSPYSDGLSSSMCSLDDRRMVVFLFAPDIQHSIFERIAAFYLHLCRTSISRFTVIMPLSQVCRWICYSLCWKMACKSNLMDGAMKVSRFTRTSVYLLMFWDRAPGQVHF